MAKYTIGEGAALGWHMLRGAKQAAAADAWTDEDTVDPEIYHRMNRIDEKAQERWELDRSIALRGLDQAKQDLARAEFALRSAKPQDKTAARKVRNTAKQDLARVQRAANKYR